MGTGGEMGRVLGFANDNAMLAKWPFQYNKKLYCNSTYHIWRIDYGLEKTIKLILFSYLFVPLQIFST